MPKKDSGMIKPLTNSKTLANNTQQLNQRLSSALPKSNKGMKKR